MQSFHRKRRELKSRLAPTGNTCGRIDSCKDRGWRLMEIYAIIDWISIAKNLQNTSGSTLKTANALSWSGVTSTRIRRASHFVRIAVHVLTSITIFQWNRVPSIVSVHTSSESIAIHTNKPCATKKKYFNCKDHVTDDLITWRLSHVASVEEVGLVRHGRGSRIDVTSPRRHCLRIYLN